MGKRLQCVIIVIASIALSACFSRLRHDTPYVTKPTAGILTGAASGAMIGSASTFGAPIGAAIGGVAGGIIGYDAKANEPHILQLEKRLIHEGVQFVRIGEDQKIVLPADRLFYANAPRLKNDAHQILDLVVAYMRYFNTTSVKIIGYMDCQGASDPPLKRQPNGKLASSSGASMDYCHGFAKRNLVLSRYRAQNVLDYLTMKQLDTRLIVAGGRGSEHPIATNRLPYGRSMNRRIEISYRMLES